MCAVCFRSWERKDRRRRSKAGRWRFWDVTHSARPRPTPSALGTSIGPEGPLGNHETARRFDTNVTLDASSLRTYRASVAAAQRPLRAAARSYLYTTCTSCALQQSSAVCAYCTAGCAYCQSGSSQCGRGSSQYAMSTYTGSGGRTSGCQACAAASTSHCAQCAALPPSRSCTICSGAYDVSVHSGCSHRPSPVASQGCSFVNNIVDISEMQSRRPRRPKHSH